MCLPSFNLRSQKKREESTRNYITRSKGKNLIIVKRALTGSPVWVWAPEIRRERIESYWANHSIYHLLVVPFNLLFSDIGVRKPMHDDTFAESRRQAVFHNVHNIHDLNLCSNEAPG